MIVLDTCALIFDALEPHRLGRAARHVFLESERSGPLACSDISLWEIAMLVDKGRLDPGAPVPEFLDLMIRARSLEILPISPAIAVRAASGRFGHGDPADRLIAATALAHDAPLVTCDKRLRDVDGLRIIW